MSAEPFTPPQRVPTLTEVVTWPEAALPDLPAAAQAEAAAELPADAAGAQPQPPPQPQAQGGVAGEAPSASAALPPPISEEQLVRRVLADVQRQVDLMLDYRLRETLSPILARAADALVRETRHDLALTLKDIVARSVAQELTRLRGR